jgi:hypothetical protein
VFHPYQHVSRFVRTIGICLVLLALGSGTLVQADEPVQDLEAPMLDDSTRLQLTLRTLALIQEEDLPQQEAEGILSRTL